MLLLPAPQTFTSLQPVILLRQAQENRVQFGMLGLRAIKKKLREFFPKLLVLFDVGRSRPKPGLGTEK